MRFEIQHCVPTYMLDDNTFKSLIDKLILEGYNLPSLYLDDLKNWKDFDWIGVNTHNDVLLYSESPWFYHHTTTYGKENSGSYPYIYSKRWLNRYLEVETNETPYVNSSSSWNDILHYVRP